MRLWRAYGGAWTITTRRGVNYGLRWLPRRWWWQVWTPVWHEGRGRYVTVGLWLVAYHRGY